MTDPVAALILLVAAFAALALVWSFKTLDGDLWHSWRTPVVAGLAAGIALRLLRIAHPAAFGVVLSLVALYVRLTGQESEPVDGMLLGAASGAAAAIPFGIDGRTECLTLAECLIAGAVAGYGITWASFHVTDRVRQLLIDAVTAVAAVGLAWLPPLIHQDRAVAIAVVAIIPSMAMVTVFRQWPDIRAQLSHEASHGFMRDADVRRTAHPFLRLGSGGWTDRKAHREFVRLANQIALRKRQQRNRPPEIARLYQVEIIKLRMQIQAMSKIDRDVVARSDSDDLPSDTIARSK